MRERPTAFVSRLRWLVLACLLARPVVAVDTTQRLRLPQGLPENFEVVVHHDGVAHTLRLERHSLRAPGFRARAFRADGTTVEVVPPEPATYRGHLVGADPAPVVAELGIDGLSARVMPASGTAWTIRPLPGEARASGAPRHRVGHEIPDEPPGHPEWCRTDLTGSRPSPPRGASRSHTGQHQAEVAFDVTHSLYVDSGSTVAGSIAAIEAIMNDVDFYYARDTMITYTITDILVRTAPFYTAITVDNVKAEWNTNQAHIQRDMAHAVELEVDGPLGAAAPGTACDVSEAYAHSTNTANVVGHELGHNWNTAHCHDIYACNNMCGSCFYISADTKDIITEFRDTVSCLDDLGSYSQPLPPYAHPEGDQLSRDEVQSQATRSFDVLLNDHDGNLDPLTIDTFDATSIKGGTIVLSPGAGGADELVYTAPGQVFGGHDRFTYTVGDGTGQHTTGTVELRVTAPKLIGYWNMDEGAGSTIADATDGDRTGDIVGATWATGKFGAGLAFDGSSDVVTLPPFQQRLGAVTITVWLQRDGTQDPFAGIAFHSTAPDVLGFGFGNANELRYNWRDDPATTGWDSGLVPPSLQWSFAALVVEPQQATIYLHDGVTLQSSVNVAAHDLQKLSNLFTLGTDPSSPSRDFNGTLDEFRVYDYALSAAEIQDLHDSGGKAHSPHPPDGGRLHAGTLALSWSPGVRVNLHDVYFGTDYVSVRDATTASPEYLGRINVTSIALPTPAIAGVTYYWRVDEFKGGNVTTGDVWLFSRGTEHGHWKLDETSGPTATDAAGGFDGGYLGGVSLDHEPATPELGRSAYFDGLDDTVEAPALGIDSDEVTITTWLRRDGVQPDVAGLVYTRDLPTAGAGFNLAAGPELSYDWTGGEWNGIIDSNSFLGLAVPDDTWVFAALVVEPDRATAYLGQGGTLTRLPTFLANGRETFDSLLYLGQDPLGGRNFRGRMDDVRIYDHALPPADVAALFTDGVGAGRVPNGADVPGAPLMVDRLTGGDVALSWSASCAGTDGDYSVYEGELGNFTSHQPVTCSTGGAVTAQVTPKAGNRYFLVVPNSANREGSYGTGAAQQRPPSVSACRRQYIAACD